MTDQDLELLDAYLDGGLSKEEMRAVEARLLSEAGMADELSRQREARQVRAQVWQSMEPSEREVDHFMQRIEKALERRGRFSLVLNNLRVISAAAACILLGFVTGWMGRSQPGLGQMDPGSA